MTEDMYKRIGIINAGLIMVFLGAAVFFRLDGVAIAQNSDSVQAELPDLREEAVEAARAGQMEKAYDLIQKAYAQKPDDPKVVADYAAILAWMENYNEAVRFFEKNNEPALPDYAMREVIRSYREIGRHEKAVSLSDQYLLEHPEDFDVLKGEIYSLIETKQYAKADGKLTVAEQSDPQKNRIKSLKAFLYAVQKKFSEFFNLAEMMKKEKDAVVRKQLDEACFLVYEEAVELARQEEYDRALEMIDRLKTDGYENPKMEMDRIVVYVWKEEFERAVKEYQKIPTDKPLPPYFLEEVARAYHEIDGAVEIKGKHWEYIEPYVRSAESVEERVAEELDAIRSLAGQGKTEEALNRINEVLQKDPRQPDALFLKAEIYDQREEYWLAVQTYNQILAIYPKNQQAFNLKLRTLMDLGATSLVVEQSEAHPDLVDPTIAERARTDVPMHQIRWEESEAALGQLSELEQEYVQSISEEEPNKDYVENYWRVKWDSILAMRQQNRMTEIIREYEKLTAQGEKIPPWVDRAAADAYLYEQEPEKALEIYEKLVKDDQSFDLEMSVYYTLIDLGRYKDAEAVLDRVDAKTPAKIVERGILQDNFKKADIAINRAWLLMYQDKLAKAEQYIAKVKSASPFNTDLRTAEAHNHLYRGWKRRAMEDFKTVRTIDDQLVSAHIGYASALYQNMDRRAAHDALAKVLAKEPRNKHALRMQREFDVAEMSTVSLSSRYSHEDVGEDEYTLVLRGEHPVNFHHTLFAETTFREETQDPINQIARKIVVGDQWQIDNTWRLLGAITGDYEGKGNVGYLAGIRMEPDDHWTFDFSTESDTLDISSRSRQNGVDADLYSLSAAYRMSELFDTVVGITYKDFTDGNAYFNYLWRTSTAVTTAAYWKTRLLTEFGFETFSDQDVAYFSPEKVYTLYLIPMVEHAWFRRYTRSWVDRFYVGLGQKWQDSFGATNAGFVRYEQDHQFSDTKSLLVGISYDLNYYDSDDVNALVVYSTARFKF